MTTLEKIIAGLKRQHEASRAGGIGWLDVDDPAAAVIDGRVNLHMLAAAIEDERKATSEPEGNYAWLKGPDRLWHCIMFAGESLYVDTDRYSKDTP